MSAKTLLILLTVALVGAFAVWRLMPHGPSEEEVTAAYATPPAPLERPVSVFHLGHSLVGRDMPAMLAQLAGEGHSYDSQLGWGTSLREHWEPDVPINGFETENAHARYRDAREALASGDYDAFVLTEMVEIRDAIRYHDSARYIRLWQEAARAGNPDIRVFLYEAWHRTDGPEDWLARLDGDLARHWEGDILLPGTDLAHPVYVIPAGQVFAHFVRRVEAAGGIGKLTSRTGLFSDEVHVSDLGAYLVALTHYAVIYQQSPIGLPHALLRADGTPADAPGPELARAMQESVWEVVTSYPKTGVRR